MLMLFASLLAIPLALSILASADDFRKYVDSVLASVGLCVIWAFVTVIAKVYPFPESKQFHSLIDLIALGACIGAAVTQFERWKLILALLFCGQLWLHAWFRSETLTVADPATMIQLGRTYILGLNLLWFAQLLCVSAPGGMHVGRRAYDALHRLRHRRHVPDLARH